MKTINEQLERLRELVRKCYGVVASKNGEVPSEKTMENLPSAIASTHDTLEELTITQNGEYTPQEGVDGFSKVVAEFDPSSLPKVKVSAFRVSNDCINEDGIWEGDSLIDISECTNFTSIFAGVSNLKQLNVSEWDSSNVTSFNTTFQGCSNLETLDVSNWNVSKATTMYGMFYSGVPIKSIDFSKWNVNNLTNISYFGLNNALTYIGGRTIDEVLANNIKCLNGLRISFYVYSRNLDRASLRALINGLYDLTGQDPKTLTLGETLLAKLTEEDIAIATNKNWTIA